MALSRVGAPPGIRSPEQGVELVDQSGPLGGEVAAALVEQHQHRGQVLGDDGVGVAVQGGDAGRGSRVDDVVLAAPTP